MDNNIKKSENETDLRFEKKIEHNYSSNYYDVQLYIMELALDTYSQNNDPLPTTNPNPKVRYKIGLSPTSIINFTIKETLANWVTTAELTIQSPSDDILKDLDTQSTKLFNNDGSDLLYVKIIPSDISFVGQRSTKSDWKLEYTFAISDIVDIENPVGLEGLPTNPSIRCKKLYLVDYKYHLMQSKKLLYSSYFPSENETVNQRPEGIKETGLMIRDIFRLCGFSKSLPPLNSKKEEYKNSWDIGSSKMFYTASSDSKASDVLDYIYAHHTSENSKTVIFKNGELKSNLNGVSGGKAEVFDFCILKSERSPNSENIETHQGIQDMYVGEISLVPMMKYFENAGNEYDSPGKFQVEHFFVPDSLQNSEYEPFRSPVDIENKTPQDFKQKGYSEIVKYTLMDMSALTNIQLFKSTPVISNNMKTGEFKMELMENRIETVKRFIADNYIENLYRAYGNESSQNDDYFLVSLDKTKDLYNINSVYSLYGGIEDNPIRQSYGIQNLLKMGIFLNQGINFKVPGLTLRTSGRFIGIDKYLGADSESLYDEKLLGQYFVIDVKHIFEGTSYYNDITAIKIHNWFPIPKSKNSL